MNLRPALLSLIACMTLHSAPATEIIAHRGASKDAPENTMAAFRVAWEQKADAIELDTYLTADGRIAVIHDASTKRTAGLDKKVVAQSLADLQRLDAGTWKDAKWAGERIPSLEEVLATIPEGKRVFIEVKCGPEILPELARVIGACPCKPAQLVIIGFGYDTMKQAKALLPQLEVYWIVGTKKDPKDQEPVEALIPKAQAAKLNGLDLDYRFPIDAAFVERVHAAKMKLYVWTVDDASRGQALRTAGVDGITTNVPALIREAK